MKDVARIAGVSHQTVSRVLNGHPSVSASVRERVETVIEELGYRRNVAARSLVTRRSRTVGVLATELVQYGPSRTLLGLESAARDADYFVSIATVRDVSIKSVREALNHLGDQSVDGIVVVVPHPGILEALSLIEHSFPVVTATSATGGPLGSAAVNQRLGARMAVQHLIELGHTRIGHVSGPMNWFDAVERVEGWREALTEAGLQADILIQGDWTAERGYEAGLSLGSSDASAFFIANDQMALGFLRGVQECGLRVPDDVSIVGYDDQPDAGFFYPPLTTVKQDFEELGRRSIKALLEQLDSGTIPPKQMIDPAIVVRASSGPLRR
ncbi:LacI family DNA-binding transcriptional regulator [Arthrobacter sp. ISL-30]|uniref:LacI family DNA-binding transcriptional regulator n=1 Tax=Arthrobacter sp. ISL-30 TaxID=2819109 RepID=UPI001BE80051|nr:LacI family DNA-binding transcriptional regulator [Arthrobacter sp. ISL-30]MBT2513803.1 LacI family DNA-binding transcriptional regulator [Arthrobacter sp. ISL-30]